MKTRPLTAVLRARPTREGAGVSLSRVFGFDEVPDFDPFLLLDDFRSDDPAAYRAGFPWHPHRGIVHQEMPRGAPDGRMYGFQLWANLPARDKWMAPRYRDVRAADVPEVVRPDGNRIKVIAGTVDGVAGPVRDVVIAPTYLDAAVPPLTRFAQATPRGHTVFAYIFEGRVAADADGSPGDPQGNGSLLRFGGGDQVVLHTVDEPARVLLISGRPLGEPVAWGGPIVMNTDEEVRQAFDEYRAGTFLRHRGPILLRGP